MRRVSIVHLLIFAVVGGCKQESGATALKDIDDANTGVEHFTDDWFIPYSNTGLDPAFCAGTSALHALAFNRARFHAANPPSQKCPARFTTNDDQRYDAAVWAILEQEALKTDFTSTDTIQVYGARSFGEFGERNLALFAQTVRRVQDQIGAFDYWLKKGVDSEDFTTLPVMAESVRQKNFLLAFGHVQSENPVPQNEVLRKECEAKGWRWDEIAEQCDTRPAASGDTGSDGSSDKRTDPTDDSDPFGTDDSPTEGSASQSPSADFGADALRNAASTGASSGSGSNSDSGSGSETPEGPGLDRKKGINHAVLIIGANDDDSLRIYTTWSRSVSTWTKSFAIPEHGQYMINPALIRRIPVMAFDDRSQAVDLMKQLNDHYGYSGANAGTGCPVAGEQAAASTSPEAAESADYDSFDYTLQDKIERNAQVIRVTDLRGCSGGEISWTIAKTYYVERSDSSEQDIAYTRFKTAADSTSFSYPVERDYNRFQVTGVCKDRAPRTYQTVRSGVQQQRR